MYLLFNYLHVMLHFLCTACERKDRQSVAATPTATFPALVTRIPSAHLFTHTQFSRKHTQAVEIETNAHFHVSIQPRTLAYARVEEHMQIK